MTATVGRAAALRDYYTGTRRYPPDLGVLKTVAKHNSAASATLAPGVVLSAVAGVYASVENGGLIAHGASVELS